MRRATSSCGRGSRRRRRRARDCPSRRMPRPSEIRTDTTMEHPTRSPGLLATAMPPSRDRVSTCSGRRYRMPGSARATRRFPRPSPHAEGGASARSRGMLRRALEGPPRWKSCARPTSASRACPASPLPRTTSSVDGLRMHYVDEGPRDGAGGAAAARRAVLVVSLPQADSDPRRGRACARWRPISSASGAPTSPRAARPTAISSTWTGWAASSTATALRDITLVCQDWGGLLGLRLVGRDSARLRARGGGKHVLADGRRAAGPRLPRLAQVLAGDAALPRRAAS